MDGSSMWGRSVSLWGKTWFVTWRLARVGPRAFGTSIDVTMQDPRSFCLEGDMSALRYHNTNIIILTTVLVQPVIIRLYP